MLKLNTIRWLVIFSSIICKVIVDKYMKWASPYITMKAQIALASICMGGMQICVQIRLDQGKQEVSKGNKEAW